MKERNKPAFPTELGGSVAMDWTLTLPGQVMVGLTKREYFAGLALVGNLALRSHENVDLRKVNAEGLAFAAVTYADALLAELDKTKK